VMMLLAMWTRVPRTERREVRLERRAGGLRLRSAVAFGLIFFLETNALAMPELLARLAHDDYFAAGVMLCLGSVIATLLLLTAWGPVGRHRRAAALLGAAATLGILVAWKFSGWGVAIFFAGGHTAALLLLGRSLVPAGGRRGGWTVSSGFLVLLAFEALYAGTFFFAFTFSSLEGLAPWLFGAAGVLLEITLVLIPRPNRSAPLLRRRLALLYGMTATILAASAVAVLRASEPGPVSRTSAAPHTDPGVLRVATYNVHGGFSEDWRYDPESIARAIERTNSDVVALQELPAGVPFAYGTDLTLWLGHRLKMRADFAPAVNQLLGDALLSRVPVQRVRSLSLRVDAAALNRAVDPKVMIAEDVLFGGQSLTVYGARLDGDPQVQRIQMDRISSAIEPGPAVFTGDLKADDLSPAGAALRAAGFVDAFESAGRPPSPTVPERVPTQRADWIWVRGLRARSADVLDARGSDHRLVAAELVSQSGTAP
jgi:endonuclease/exonuclease/phosphatase family metal-dependent hydrolase